MHMENGRRESNTGWTVSVIISAFGTVCLVLLLIFCCIHFMNRQEDGQQAGNTPAGRETESLTGESAAAEAPLTAEEIFQAYIQWELIPAYGLFETPQQGEMRTHEDKWLKPSGILSADISDLDRDGEEELLLLRMQKEGEGYSLQMDVYERVNGEAVLADSKPAAPYIEEREDTSGGQYLSENCWTTILWDVTAVEAQAATYLVCESQQVWNYFSNGASQDYWAFVYNGQEIQYACSFTQTAGGSSDFAYHGYEFQEGNLKNGELLYSEWVDEQGAYDDFGEALGSLFDKYGIRIKALDYGWSNESVLADSNQMERILEFTNAMVSKSGQSYQDTTYTFEANVSSDAGLRERLNNAETADTEASSIEPEAKDEADAVVNNGGTVVRYDGCDYYWKYSDESISDTGLFAYYSVNYEAENQMVRRSPDGSEEILFTMPGCGDIYILGDRMYLTEDGYSRMYSVKLDGSGWIDYNGSTAWGADESAETLLVSKYDEDTGSTWLTLIHNEDGSEEKVLEGTWNYAGTADGYAYFSREDEDTYQLALYRYKLDGTEEVKEMDRISVPSDYLYAAVQQVTVLEDTLYYSYGYYAGTGYFFQEGGINSVRMDGSGQQVCVSQGGITAKEFQVVNKNGTVKLYYIDDRIGVGSEIGYWDDAAYEGSILKNLDTGKTKQSEFRLSSPGSYVYLDGGIAVMDENQASYTTVIPADIASGFGCSEFTDQDSPITIIRDLEIVGDDVYFAVQKSIRDTENDMGWRPGYQRGSTEYYRMSLADHQLEKLYSY